MFDFLGGALRKIGNTFNAEFRDFKRALFSQFFKSNSNSSQPEPNKSSEFNSSILENDALLPRSENDKKDLENHIFNIELLDNPELFLELEQKIKDALSKDASILVATEED